MPNVSPEDAAVVVSVITDISLCVDCMAKKTGLPAPRVQAVLATMSDTFKVTSGMALCAVCLTAKKVFRLA